MATLASCLKQTTHIRHQNRSLPCHAQSKPRDARQASSPFIVATRSKDLCGFGRLVDGDAVGRARIGICRYRMGRCTGCIASISRGLGFWTASTIEL